MSKVLLITRHQFKQETSKRSFLLILFMMPLFLTFIIGFGYLVSLTERDETSLGYVDQAGIVIDPSPDIDSEDLTLVAYESPELAKLALENDEIVAYYRIDPNYSESREAELVYKEEPPYQAMRHFEDVVRVNLVTDQAPEVAHRMLEGAVILVTATEYDREFPGGGPTAGLFVPLLAAAIFAFLIMTTSGYMTSVLAEEKASKTIEIVITSISEGRMMAGKVLGALGIAFLQLTVWMSFLLIGLWIGANLLDVSWLLDMVVSWRDVLAVVAVALPAYLFMAALMSLIGSMLSDPNEAEQIGPVSMLLIFLPVYLIPVIFNNPNGAVALILSFFPPTSLVTIAMRSLVMVVPMWQIGLSVLISLIAGLFLIWLAGRAFRLSMLRYGKRLKVGDLFRRKSSGQTAVSTS
jgi:ABC-2 type transport system permease protein